jgi:hypothetical protein
VKDAGRDFKHVPQQEVRPGCSVTRLAFGIPSGKASDILSRFMTQILSVADFQSFALDGIMVHNIAMISRKNHNCTWDLPDPPRVKDNSKKRMWDHRVVHCWYFRRGTPHCCTCIENHHTHHRPKRLVESDERRQRSGIPPCILKRGRSRTAIRSVTTATRSFWSWFSPVGRGGANHGKRKNASSEMRKHSVRIKSGQIL